jgi:hypothetical protein
MYVPSAFESTGSRLVIGQWKQEFLDDNISYSPSIAQRFIDGKFFVTRDGEDTFVNHNDGNEGGTHQHISRPLHLARDRWIRMIYNVRFSASDDGFIKAWMDGEQIVDYAGHGTFGRTAYEAQSSAVYFKFGLYRDVDPACTVSPNAPGCTMTIYFDHYCRGASRAEVEADCSDDS